MPYIESYVDVDIDVDDFLEHCSEKELKNVVEWLRDEGRVSNIEPSIPENKLTFMDKEWIEKCQKLVNIRLQMSKEDEELILNILKKY